MTIFTPEFISKYSNKSDRPNKSDLLDQWNLFFNNINFDYLHRYNILFSGLDDDEFKQDELFAIWKDVMYLLNYQVLGQLTVNIYSKKTTIDFRNILKSFVYYENKYNETEDINNRYATIDCGIYDISDIQFMSAHAIGIVIDFKHKKIIFYDPIYRLDYNVEKLIFEELKSYLPLWTGVFSKETNSKINIQIKERNIESDLKLYKNNGLCFVWTLIFLHARMHFTKIKTEDLELFLYKNKSYYDLELIPRAYLTFLFGFSKIKTKTGTKNGTKRSTKSKKKSKNSGVFIVAEPNKKTISTYELGYKEWTNSKNSKNINDIMTRKKTIYNLFRR